MKWARSKRTRVGLPLSSSTSRLLPSRLLFSVDSFPPPVRRDPRPLDTRNDSRMRARERALSEKGKERRRKREKERERKKKME